MPPAVHRTYYHTWKSPLPFLFTCICLLLCGSGLYSQQGNLDGPGNIPVRVTSNPVSPLLGGPQLPPYPYMGSFLANAFESPKSGIQFVQDSSLCVDGIAGTQDFEPFLHAEYEYTDNRLSEIIFSRINGPGERSPFSRKRFSYDGDNLDTYGYSRWDDGSGLWTDHSREQFQYTKEGRVKSVVMQTWSGSAWINGARTSLTYDGSQLTSAEYDVWQNDQWLPMQRSVATYNDNRLPTVVAHQEYDTGVWSTQIRESYTYDAGLEFFLQGYLLQERDSVTAELDSVLREVYDYDQRGFFSGRIAQVVDSAGHWKNVFHDFFKYSSIGVWKSWTRQVWTGEWQDQFQRDFRLAEGLQVDIEHVWDSMNGEWMQNRRRFVQFDEYGNLTRERNFEVWNPGSQAWINGPATRQCHHFWSEKKPSSIISTAANQLDCSFMNPYLLESEIRCLSDKPQAEYVALLFDQMGRMIHEKAFLGGEPFAVGNDIPSGIYYLLISDHREFLYRGKMMINQQ